MNLSNAFTSSSIFCSSVGMLATQSLLYEVSVTPKPGLVDRFNNGSHSDMDFFSFLKSSCALFPYFCECVNIGLSNITLSEEENFLMLRSCGLQAEASMFMATGGVNTHRGAIFSLGLLLASVGRLFALNKPFNEEVLFTQVASLALPSLKDFQLSGNPSTPYTRFSMKGARGEAAQGFPHVRLYALPAYRAARQSGYSLNDSGVWALLHLIAWTDDTNIVMRSDMDTLFALKERVKTLLKKDTLSMEEILLLDQQCKDIHISPGGCADLLAITFFIGELLPNLLKSKDIPSILKNPPPYDMI